MISCGFPAVFYPFVTLEVATDGKRGDVVPLSPFSPRIGDAMPLRPSPGSSRLAPASPLQRPADHRSPPVHGAPCAARRVYRCAPPLSVFRAEAPPSHAFLAAEMKQLLTGSDDLDGKLDSAAFRIQFSTSIMTLVPRASAIRLAASACEENSHDYQANPHQFGIRAKTQASEVMAGETSPERPPS